MSLRFIISPAKKMRAMDAPPWPVREPRFLARTAELMRAVQALSRDEAQGLWACSDRLADLWVCQVEQYRDYARFEKCAKCELLAWCRGCPAVASGRDGSFYAADPQCWKEIG